MNRQPSGSPVGGQFAEGRKPSGPDFITSDETAVMDVKVTVNRKTGEVSVTTDGTWSGLEEFDQVWDQPSETAQGIIEENSDEYIKPNAILFSNEMASKFDDMVANAWDPDGVHDDDELYDIQDEATNYLMENPPANLTDQSLLMTVKKWAWEKERGRELVKFHVDSDPVAALDEENDEISLSAKDVDGALFDRDDGQFTHLILMDGRTVRLDPIDVESDYYSD